MLLLHNSSSNSSHSNERWMGLYSSSFQCII